MLKNINPKQIKTLLFRENLKHLNKLNLHKMSTVSLPVKEIKINVPYGHLAAKVWNESGKNVPILAVHGWMDNAGTWDKIAPLLLKNHPMIAIDLPGHGLSSPPPMGLGAYLIDNVVTIHSVIQHFQWNKVILLGHSMGGGCAMLYAGALPDNVEKLIMVDIFSPVSLEAEFQPKQTARSLASLLQTWNKVDECAPRYEYKDIVEKIIKAYGQSLTEESAKTLLIRGSRKHEDGRYSFSYSPILKCPSTLSMTEEQQKAFARNVTCDLLVIKADSSSTYKTKEAVREMLSIFQKFSKNFVFRYIPGTHHVHLNDPDRVADIINIFLKDESQSDVNSHLTNFIESRL